MVVNYAHRGASAYYPENTMLAFEKAISLGCDGIETDVQMTKDGELVLIHDELVNRTTNGNGFVKNYSLRELKKLNAGKWFDDKYKHIRIPTAEELVILAKGKKIMINFELKTGIIPYPNIEKRLLTLIWKYNMQKRVIISSFNSNSLLICKEITKEIKTGILFLDGLENPIEYCKSIGADAIHPPFNIVNGELMNRAHEAGLEVNPYTVNEEINMLNLILIGVDGIITNYPDRLKKLLKEKKH